MSQRFGLTSNAFSVELSPEMVEAFRQVFWQSVVGQWSAHRLKETLASGRVPGFVYQVRPAGEQ